MTFICGGGSAAPDAALRALVGLADCCIGAITDGPAGCTCWEQEFDLEQAPPDTDLVPTTRDKMCDDCAYRPTSPERTGDEGYAFGDEELPSGPVPFWCHQGIRKPLRYRHRLGIVVEATGDHYAPPEVTIDGAGVPFRADGTPAQRCAGWAAMSRGLTTLVKAAE